MLAQQQPRPGNCKCWNGFGHMIAPGISKACVEPLLKGELITPIIKAWNMMLGQQAIWEQKGLAKG